jgi:hypothetical protein
MFAVTTNDDELDYYNGTSWVSALPVGAWKAYTPTTSGITLGTGSTVTFAYCQIGKTVHVRGAITLGTGGAVTTTVDIGTPVSSTGYILGATVGNFVATNHTTYYLGTNISVANNGEHTHTFTTNSTGSNSSVNIMNPYLVLNYLIKY